MIVLDVKDLGRHPLQIQQQVVARRDGNGSQVALSIFSPTAWVSPVAWKIDGAVAARLMKPLRKCSGSAGRPARHLEVTDLGELALAILCHLKPLGDDAVVVAHQQEDAPESRATWVTLALGR